MEKTLTNNEQHYEVTYNPFQGYVLTPIEKPYEHNLNTKLYNYIVFGTLERITKEGEIK